MRLTWASENHRGSVESHVARGDRRGCRFETLARTAYWFRCIYFYDLANRDFRFDGGESCALP
jgi:hypothetical protein